MESALKHVNNVVLSNSLNESQQAYENWSATYDKDLEVLGSFTATETIIMFQKYGMDSKVMLDLGGGTGGVVEHIRDFGYNGIVDILDANLPMLVEAEKKGCNFRNIIRHCVTEDGRLPLRDEEYDVVTSCGCFLPNHIPATAFRGVLNVLKKGGMFIISMRSSSTEPYKKEFDQIVEELKNEKKIEVLEEKEFPHFINFESNIKSVVITFKKL